MEKESEAGMSDDKQHERKAKKKACKKEYYHLSTETPDKKCFYDETFFHDTNEITFDGIKEAKMRLKEYGKDKGFIVSVKKRKSNYLLAKCISHDRCPCFVQIGPKTRGKALLGVKKMDCRHCKGTHGKEGRKKIQQDQPYVKKRYERVVHNTTSTLTPRDVMRSCARNDAVNVTYSAAYWCVKKRKGLL